MPNSYPFAGQPAEIRLAELQELTTSRLASIASFNERQTARLDRLQSILNRIEQTALDDGRISWKDDDLIPFTFGEYKVWCDVMLDIRNTSSNIAFFADPLYEELEKRIHRIFARHKEEGTGEHTISV